MPIAGAHMRAISSMRTMAGTYRHIAESHTVKKYPKTAVALIWGIPYCCWPHFIDDFERSADASPAQANAHLARHGRAPPKHG